MCLICSLEISATQYYLQRPHTSRTHSTIVFQLMIISTICTRFTLPSRLGLVFATVGILFVKCYTCIFEIFYSYHGYIKQLNLVNHVIPVSLHILCRCCCRIRSSSVRSLNVRSRTSNILIYESGSSH